MPTSVAALRWRRQRLSRRAWTPSASGSSSGLVMSCRSGYRSARSSDSSPPGLQRRSGVVSIASPKSSRTSSRLLVKPGPNCDGPFLARAFSAIGPRDQFQIAANGITCIGLGGDAFRTGLFAIPPAEEQRAIAAFLDRETARIETCRSAWASAASGAARRTRVVMNTTRHGRFTPRGYDGGNQAARVAQGAQDASELRLHARTTCPGWLGERLDVGWAIDILHPRANRDSRSRRAPDHP
jgi:hypothetical protein